MQGKTAVVVTTISGPNPVLLSLAELCRDRNWTFYIIGDVKSPPDFSLDGCHYLDIAAQLETDLRTARDVPTRHYARKNIGYLLAAKDKAEIIVETDDDNFPTPAFGSVRCRRLDAPVVLNGAWVNAYRYFAGSFIWPRGFPLQAVRSEVKPYEQLEIAASDCPIQQGLADENPDVDAIYRLLLPLPQSFRSDRRVVLGKGSWCPFNSQNTTWWREAFPLLYLPAYCSFRMTDIWRSFVAQRIAWENGWSILFHEPTVWQERNEHNLLVDFKDEVPGYLGNHRIAEILDSLTLKSGTAHLAENLLVCYEKLIAESFFDPAELSLLQAWIEDLAHC